jgi:hypothetical protein
MIGPFFDTIRQQKEPRMKKTYRNHLCLLAYFLLFFLKNVNPVVHASDNDVTRLSLGGLDGVVVLAETVSSEMKQEGLTREVFFSDVAAALRKAGIEPLTVESEPGIPGNPYLYVNVHAFKSTEYVYSIGLEFRQSVFLSRNPDLKIDAVTWSKRYIGTTQLKEDIRSHLKGLTGIFINAYQSANPGDTVP